MYSNYFNFGSCNCKYMVPYNGIAVTYDFLLGSRSFAYECKLLFLKLNCLFCPFDAQKTSKQYDNFETSSSREIILQHAKWMVKWQKIWCCSSPKVPSLFRKPHIYPLVSFTLDFLQFKQLNYVPDFRLFCQLQISHATNRFQLT